MSTGESTLVVSAHSADFVWRAGGAIALAAARGDPVTVLCLSYGERGESASAWRAGQNLEQIKALRRSEAENAAAALGAEIEFLDAGDYPLRETDDLVDRIVGVYRRVNPSAVLTHPLADPYNQDHPAAAQMALRARVLAQAIGYPAPGEPIGAPPVFLFEPHQPELCGFKPEVFLDIASVFEAKRNAFEAMAAQQHRWEYYTDLAKRRGTQLRRNAGPNLGLPQSTWPRPTCECSRRSQIGSPDAQRDRHRRAAGRPGPGRPAHRAGHGHRARGDRPGRIPGAGRARQAGRGLRHRGHGPVLPRRQPDDPRRGRALPGGGPAGVTTTAPSTDGMFGDLLATSLAPAASAAS